jgi:GT2 family glycosyltransferase
MTTLTTVIPTRGFVPLLRICLDRLAAALARAARDRPLAATTVVVDNATPHPLALAADDGPPSRVLRFDTQHSFAACCNRAAAVAPADRVFLLNNDVLLDPGTLAAMMAVLDDDPTVGICGTRLVFPDGRLQHGGVRFAPQLGPYHHDRGRAADTVPRTPFVGQAVTGACMLVRGEVWTALGGLDEAYPFGLEDIDLCLRAGQAGWTIRCTHATDSLHFESMTPGRVALDRPSRALFMERWRGRYTIDGEDPHD